MAEDLEGDRVRLIHTSDQYTTLQPGTEGTVLGVDDAGTVHVKWDDGPWHIFGLIPGVDSWTNLGNPDS